MDLPFSGFELTFITIAFFVFSLYSLASIYIQPSAAGSGKHCSSLSDTHTHTGKCFSLSALNLSSDIDYEAVESKELTQKQRVITKEAEWSVTSEGIGSICSSERTKTTGFSEENHKISRNETHVLWPSVD